MALLTELQFKDLSLVGVYVCLGQERVSEQLMSAASGCSPTQCANLRKIYCKPPFCSLESYRIKVAFS